MASIEGNRRGRTEIMTTDAEERISAVRRFNRFYTRQIGLLQEGYLESPFSLAEVRALYELAHGDGTTATELGGTLRLDTDYLSRILRGFESQGLISREPSPGDGRQRTLHLTEAGREAFAPLDMRSRRDIGAMLGDLAEDDQARLVNAIMTIERVLDGRQAPDLPYVIRPPRAGDMG